MVKRAVMAALVVLCLGALIGTALAAPSAIVWLPSTDIQAKGVNHFDYDGYRAQDNSGGTTSDLGLLFGNGKLEYGFDVFTDEYQNRNEPVYLNAKYLLVDENDATPKFAVGTFYFGDHNGSNLVYGVFSKTFPLARLTAGYVWGRESQMGDDNTAIMLGLDKQLNDKWWIGADYASGDSWIGCLSGGINYAFTENVKLGAAYSWANDDEEWLDSFALKLDVNF
jgi:opacity protein-like surface antigen